MTNFYDEYPDDVDIYVKKGYHETKNGTLIKIPDMSTQHIINTIRLAEVSNWSTKYIDQLRHELNKRL